MNEDNYGWEGIGLPEDNYGWEGIDLPRQLQGRPIEGDRGLWDWCAELAENGQYIKVTILGGQIEYKIFRNRSVRLVDRWCVSTATVNALPNLEMSLAHPVLRAVCTETEIHGRTLPVNNNNRLFYSIFQIVPNQDDEDEHNVQFARAENENHYSHLVTPSGVKITGPFQSMNIYRNFTDDVLSAVPTPLWRTPEYMMFNLENKSRLIQYTDRTEVFSVLDYEIEVRCNGYMRVIDQSPNGRGKTRISFLLEHGLVIMHGCCKFSANYYKSQCDIVKRKTRVEYFNGNLHIRNNRTRVYWTYRGTVHMGVRTNTPYRAPRHQLNLEGQNDAEQNANENEAGNQHRDIGSTASTSRSQSPAEVRDIGTTASTSRSQSPAEVRDIDSTASTSTAQPPADAN